MGLVGSALLQNLQKKGYANLLTRTHQELDLVDCDSVAEFFAKEKPEYVFLAAAKVGGIKANATYRADFIYKNLMIQNNVIHQCYLQKVKKLMFLGSTCIYPDNCEQPIKEEYLLTGTLEYTNEPYAIAKIAGIKMCESYNLQYGTNFIAAMPTNLYGPGDNFNLENSHVLPALLRKFHLGVAILNDSWEDIRNNLQRFPIEGISAKSSKDEILKVLNSKGIHFENGKVKIEIWGSGKPLREFLHNKDMAEACVYLMNHVDFTDIIKDFNPKEIRNTHINIGSGKEISIKELSLLIAEIVGYKGELLYNSNKLEGTFRKLTDVSKLSELGWTSKIALREGINLFYKWYKKEFQKMKEVRQDQ